MGFLLYNMGDLAAAEEQLELCSSLAAELGSSRQQALATFPLALIKYLRGDLEEAERLGERAHVWLERTGDTYFQIQNLVALAQFALARDDPLLAEERLREALPLALAEGNWLAGDIYRFLAEALVRQGRIDDAAELVEFAARGVSAESPPHLRVAILLGEATVATAKRDAAVALERYEEALVVLEELDSRIDLSVARIGFARALRELAEYERAREMLELARESCLAMGATGLASEVERELALMGSRAG
jgi:tetratricopeptide (TPR) repeat protein